MRRQKERTEQEKARSLCKLPLEVEREERMNRLEAARSYRREL